MLEFREVSIFSNDAQLLIHELNEALIQIIGNDGSGHVNPQDFQGERAVFLIGYDENTPICCAGIRQENEETCELKRVYARKNHQGYGRALMAEVETWARKHNYQTAILECRDKNPQAIEFYRKNGYTVSAQYPPYVGVKDAVCMRKSI